MEHKRVVAYRKKFGNNWLTVFPEGLEIPWRQLTLQEFLDYSELFNSGRYTEVEVEDEIFSTAVLDPLFIENIDILPSGNVSTVVAQILSVSGPQSIQDINQDLNIARQQTDNLLSHLVTIICSVFPAYKPEELLVLPYQEFMKRATMAEHRLLSLGILKEPLSALVPGEEIPAVQTPEKPSDRKRRELLEKKFSDLNKRSEIKSDPNNIVIDKSRMMVGDILPEGELSKNPQDYLINQKKINEQRKTALEGLEAIYPDYFKMMKEGKKITPQTIKETRGTSKEQVEAHHKEYIEKLKSGEIKVPEKKPIIGKKVKVKRR